MAKNYHTNDIISDCYYNNLMSSKFEIFHYAINVKLKFLKDFLNSIRLKKQEESSVK